MMRSIAKAGVAALAVSSSACAMSSSGCAVTLAPSYPAPVVGSGWSARLIAQGISGARGIVFDSTGALLVSQPGTGISRLVFTDNGGTCLTLASNTLVTSQPDLTHGIELSADGKTLFASSAEAVYTWLYDDSDGTVGESKIIIQNMTNDDHISRTLTLSTKQPNLLLVSRGSGENIDLGTRDISSGRSQIKVFDLDTIPDSGPYDYANDGTVLGWGLRNDVGVAEEPLTGGIYSVENSADQLTRDGVDVHTDDPGEELNFLGSLDSIPSTPPNFGYPDCFALWNATDFPNSEDLSVGDQFTQTQTPAANDSICAANAVSPRLTFQAHMAPLDIKFTPDGSTAFVTFHGSWNRSPPIGYKVSTIAFSDGEPVEPATSTTALTDILSNQDLNNCPGECFRPVGLALDTLGRVYVSGDATGEIWVLQKNAWY